MTDIVDKKTRSRMMAGIQGRNTRPELLLRKVLHAKGFRFRLHVAGMPGRPDVVLPKYGAVIFVHGCFWHRHEGCRYATQPSTREDFWRAKFEANVARDLASGEALRAAGWRTAIIWECALKSRAAADEASGEVSAWLLGPGREFEFPRQQ